MNKDKTTLELLKHNPKVGMAYIASAMADADILQKISRLAKAHKRQCENECNGEGWIPRKGFFRLCGPYSARVQDAHVSIEDGYSMPEEGITHFFKEIERLEERMLSLAGGGDFCLEFQYDPRGATVKVFRNGTDYTDLIY